MLGICSKCPASPTAEDAFLWCAMYNVVMLMILFVRWNVICAKRETCMLLAAIAQARYCVLAEMSGIFLFVVGVAMFRYYRGKHYGMM